MHEGATSNLNEVLHGLHPDIRGRIIAPGTPETMLQVKERLERGDLLGILGDRVVHGEKVVMCRFLGAPTPFPDGPFVLAALLQVPVVLFFGFYLGGKDYLIQFESFAERVTGDPRRRTRDMQPWVERYAKRLEHYCRLYPYNWFNFYELSEESMQSVADPEPRAWAARHR
jgi:predicted LPLAT superfamily acyltransferase